MIQLIPIAFKLKNPFMSFGKLLTHKESLIIKYYEKENPLSLCSELSLYPGLTPELTDAHRSILQNDLDQLLNSSSQDQQDLYSLTEKLPQAFRLCVETLWLKKYFSKHFVGAKNLKIAGLITNLNSPPKVFAQTVKIKVGRTPLSTELPFLLNLLNQSDFRYRLDPNDAWTRDDIIHLDSALTPELKTRLDYIESPHDFSTQEELDEIIQSCPLPLAFDLIPARLSFDYSKAQALVIKPALLSFKESVSLMKNYEQKTQLVLSSLFEGPQGTADLLYLTNFFPPSLIKEVHGLGTLNHLEIESHKSAFDQKIEQKINELVLSPAP